MKRLTDDAVALELIDLVVAGNYIKTACIAVGVGQQTFYDWLRIGKAVDARLDAEPNADELRASLLRDEHVLGLKEIEMKAWRLRSKLLIAKAESEAYGLLMVRSAMPTTFHAALKYLEYRHPRRWKRQRHAEATDGNEHRGDGIDVAALLGDPEASRLMHEALMHVATLDAKRELKASLKRELPDSQSRRTNDRDPHPDHR